MRGALESALLGQPGEAPVARNGRQPEGDESVGEHGRHRCAAVETRSGQARGERSLDCAQATGGRRRLADGCTGEVDHCNKRDIELAAERVHARSKHADVGEVEHKYAADALEQLEGSLRNRDKARADLLEGRAQALADGLTHPRHSEQPHDDDRDGNDGDDEDSRWIEREVTLSAGRDAEGEQQQDVEDECHDLRDADARGG